MQAEYDLSKFKRRPNPFAKRLQQEVTLPLTVDVLAYFEGMAKEQGVSSQQLMSLYLQDCMVSQRKLTI
ncbi:MAG: antitoxin [Moorea sp. SIO3C2]|nr:antitoxin [Moorena sp. SIO3C2]